MNVLRSPIADPPAPLDSDLAAALARAQQQVNSVVLGKSPRVRLAFACFLAGGHLLIEDLPGVGKTTLAHALAATLHLSFQRIQFTSDLLPSDIIGVSVYERERGEFKFHPGPLFAQLVLADEINRATPKTQSALLEAMAEQQVTVDGQSRALPAPFFVVATQNPQDFAGTYQLPESQLDRFMMRLRIGYPPPHVETRLMLDPDYDRIEAVPVVLDPQSLVSMQREVDRISTDGALGAYLQALVTATRSAPALSLGASTRAGMNLSRAARARALLHGRHYCIADDIHSLAVPLLAHRVRLASHAEGYVPSRDEAETAVREVVSRVPVPL